jgi:hypothetical protein
MALPEQFLEQKTTRRVALLTLDMTPSNPEFALAAYPELSSGRWSSPLLHDSSNLQARE